MSHIGTRWHARRRSLRVGLAGALIGLLGSLALAVPAHASIAYTGILRNWQWGKCLDSNYAGNAYPLR